MRPLKLILLLVLVGCALPVLALAQDGTVPATLSGKQILLLLQSPIITGGPAFVFYCLASVIPSVGNWTNGVKRVLIFGLSLLFAASFYALVGSLAADAVSALIVALTAILATGTSSGIFLMGRNQPGNTPTP